MSDMKAIKFEVKGIMNSYKVPVFRTYQKTFLAPPKTTIIGMICNIMRKSERDYYEMLAQKDIEVSVIIEKIEGRAKDLWGYRAFRKKNHGKSVIRRDKLYKSSYSIYLKIQNQEIFEEVYQALKSPKSIPSLGQDDEIISIENVEKVDIKNSSQKYINSVFMEDGEKYEVKMLNWEKTIEMPTGEAVPMSYEVAYKDGERTERKPIELKRQIEYLNCELELIESCKQIYEYENHRMVFY